MNSFAADWWSKQPDILKVHSHSPFHLPFPIFQFCQHLTIPLTMQSAANATCALVAVSAVHAQIRHKLVVRRLHTGWCPPHCFTAAMHDSLQKVLQSDPKPLSVYPQTPLRCSRTLNASLCACQQHQCEVNWVGPCI